MTVAKAPPRDPAPGLALPAGYRFVARAGEGASAEVVCAERLAHSGERVALKLVRDRELAFREAALLGPLARRWGASLVDVGELDDGGAFLATSWVEGTNLSAMPAPASRAAREERAVVVAHAVGRALAELHQAGVRHGDVKPENILWHRRPRIDRAEDRGATLIDLGLATSIGDGARGGTAKYAAPELCSNPELAGPASDLYALGAVLRELLGEKAAGEPARWAAALLAPSPGGRPSAAWVAERAARWLELETDEEESIAQRLAQIRRAYVLLREADLGRAHRVGEGIEGAPRAWLEEAIAWRVRGSSAASDRVLEPLGPLGRARWMVSLVGPAAADWPAPDDDEARLAERFATLARRLEPAAWTLEDLVGGARAPLAFASEPSERAAALSAELVRPRPDPRVVARAEDDVIAGTAPATVRRELVAALVRAGELGRAWVLVAPEAAAAAEEPDDRALLAELARRRGDVPRATHEADLAAKGSRRESADRARATLARLAWDRGEDDVATKLLDGVESAAAAEMLALIASRRGGEEAAIAHVTRALKQTRDVEGRARLEGALGLLTHAQGNAEASARAFERAVDLAVQAGAVVEEATYLTGLAAATTDLGEIGRALDAATRAALLWDRLARGSSSARAWLSRASSLATVGAIHEVDEAAHEATERARTSGDTLAAAYARLARVDARPHGDATARAEAIAAAGELGVGTDESAVLAAARLIVWAPQEIDDARVTFLDRVVTSASAKIRWEWWGARASAWILGRRVGRAEDVLAALVALVTTPAPLGVRGPSLEAARKLAESLGDGSSARRFEFARRAAAAKLHAGAPASLRASLAAIAWARAGDGDPEPVFAPGQIAQLESIVRSLGTREGLRPLLEQVLDTLILWSGVERGVLLMRAPDGRLVPRAARNIARRDLQGDQLALSQSIARRALENGDAVVATDAFSSLGDVQASVHALRLRSVLAVPLVARGEALGVVYLDDRVKRGAFGERELAWVRLVASQAAMALADARDQVLLRRAVRRAERARAELSRLLGEREVELDIARAELRRTQDGGATRYRYDAIAGRSEAMRALLRLVDRVTASDVPVLLVGESGTGKELLARAIHDNGARQKRPFVGENCASVPESLLESILFGHVKGAFTGAHATRPGLFEVADGGTLFLDEIGEMPLSMQAKLLRVLQEGEVRPVGGDRTRRVNVRVIGATHRDLEAMVRAGTFREDLFYRLNVFSVRVPPLRERSDDVPLLVTHFLEKHAGGRKIKVTRAAMDRLASFPWPGNVRQLENEMRRALVLAEDRIDLAELSPEIAHGAGLAAKGAGTDLRSRVDALEADLVREALERTHGNQTRAAEVLGLSRFGLQKMMKRLGIRG